MSDKIQVNGGGIGFWGLLTILFIGLKLGGVITWSWFWVLSPLIFTAALAVLIIISIILLIVIGSLK
ncbi:MAG: hypothetical protein HWN81_00110 [Candidatus Lokiarchaeota archaeon]|nr:hypothetical protein [Candidatus Lokiarchaeota archaeon]